MDSVLELFEAIRTGDAPKVRSLCVTNAALVNARNARGQSAVLMACYTGRKEIRDVLVENGAMLELHEAAAAGELGTRGRNGRSESRTSEKLFAGRISGIGIGGSFWS